jgi:hypothetical protein
VTRLLGRGPGEPLLYVADLKDAEPIDAHGRELAWLGQTFELTPFDLNLLMMAIAPVLDLRYERLYAYCRTTSRGAAPFMSGSEGTSFSATGNSSNVVAFADVDNRAFGVGGLFTSC